MEEIALDISSIFHIILEKYMMLPSMKRTWELEERLEQSISKFKEKG